MSISVSELISTYGDRFDEFAGKQVMLKSYEELAAEYGTDADRDIHIRRRRDENPGLSEEALDVGGYIFYGDREKFGRWMYVYSEEPGDSRREWRNGQFVAGRSPGERIVWVPFEAVDFDYFALDDGDDSEIEPPEEDLFTSLL